MLTIHDARRKVLKFRTTINNGVSQWVTVTSPQTHVLVSSVLRSIVEVLFLRSLGCNLEVGKITDFGLEI